MNRLALAVIAAAVAALPAHAEEAGSPIYGVTIAEGYRQWQLIAPSHEAGKLDELRAILGNAVAVKAYQADTLPVPDGAILVKLAWKHVPLKLPDAFVPGAAKTVQVMVKDSTRYAATNGWGFGRFVAGKPVDKAQRATCYACHIANAADHDIVFTQLSS